MTRLSESDLCKLKTAHADWLSADSAVLRGLVEHATQRHQSLLQISNSSDQRTGILLSATAAIAIAVAGATLSAFTGSSLPSALLYSGIFTSITLLISLIFAMLSILPRSTRLPGVSPLIFKRKQIIRGENYFLPALLYSITQGTMIAQKSHETAARRFRWSCIFLMLSPVVGSVTFILIDNCTYSKTKLCITCW